MGGGKRVDGAFGKRLALRRLSDGKGRFALLAADQRPPLYQLVSAARPGISREALGEEVARLKALVVEVLGPLATGVLLDPLHGGLALDRLPRQAGLLLTLEDHRFRETPEGFRLSRPIPRWGVGSAARVGADGVKLLIWYRPDAPEEVRRHQLHLVRRVGQACNRWGQAFILEVLPYPLPGEDKPPALWEEMLRDFADPGLGVDLYKLPYVPGMPSRFSQVLPAPWVLLSGGRDARSFLLALEEALASGARGFLAGRAFWLEALSAYPDWASVREGLEASRSVMKQAVELLAALSPEGVA
jgi:tagatose 1,6-diphosphate aldolase